MNVSLADIRQWMTQYVMSLFLILGVLGNLINIYMFTRRDAMRNSCSLYLLAASVINILSIGWGIFQSLYASSNIDPSTYSFIYCKLRLYTVHTLLMIGRSLIVFACFDRFALCSGSIRLRSLCQPKKSIQLIIAHMLIWPLVTIYIPFIQNLIGNRCSMSALSNLIYAFYATIIAGILPPLLMTIFSILTIRRRRELRTRLNTIGINNRRDNAFMVMLLSQVVVYVITTSLYPTMTLYAALTTGYDKSGERLQTESFLTFLSGSFLIYLNPASPFYVYFIASQSFRKDCKEAFLGLYRRMLRPRRQIEPVMAPPHGILYANQDTHF